MTALEAEAFAGWSASVTLPDQRRLIGRSEYFKIHQGNDLAFSMA